MGTKIDAAKIAEPYREVIRSKVKKLKEAGIDAPLLVGLLANKDPAARKYAEWTRKACIADGLRYELRDIDQPFDVENELNKANDDPNVHGIIVYYPIFGQVESFSGAGADDYLRDTISYKCDVEGLCHTYRSNLYRNVRYIDYPLNTKKCLLPCTSLSVVKILEQCPGVYHDKEYLSGENTSSVRIQGRPLEGKTVTVINRSEVVGRPLAAMLANDGADVYSIDINNIYLFRDGRLNKVEEDETPESCVRKSSVVITGVPTKSYRLNTEWIQPGSTVVNVSSFKNIDEEELLKVPDVTYVPMVGKVTVAMLERNLMRLFENYHHPDRLIRNYRDDEVLSSYRDRNDDEKKEKQIDDQIGNSLLMYNALVGTVMLSLMIINSFRNK